MSQLIERILMLLGILCCLQATNALMCYDCNSEYDPRCGDPFQPYSIGEVNCSKQEPLEHLKDKYKPILCRKTLQYIYGKIRIVRGCGYIPDSRDDHECLSRSGTHDVKAVYCACTKDLCNNTPSILINNNKNYVLFTLAALFFTMLSSNLRMNTFNIMRSS